MSDFNLLTHKQLKTIDTYFQYTDKYEPIYYVTKSVKILCAQCADEHTEECKNSDSPLYLIGMRVRDTNKNHELHCSLCDIRFEAMDELEVSRQMCDIINYAVQGRW